MCPGSHQNSGRDWRCETGLSPPVKYFLLTVPRQYFFCGSFVTCVALALAKAGLVVGPLRLSVRPNHTFGFLVCVICNSKSFHSFLFILCITIVHILKMCIPYFVHIS